VKVRTVIAEAGATAVVTASTAVAEMHNGLNPSFEAMETKASSHHPSSLSAPVNFFAANCEQSGTTLASRQMWQANTRHGARPSIPHQGLPPIRPRLMVSATPTAMSRHLPCPLAAGR